MARKRTMDSGVAEANLKPAMNMILILIPLLLLSMESVRIGVINVATPQIGPSDVQSQPQDKMTEKPLKLTIALTDRGITIFAKDSVIENKDDPLGPTLPKIDGEDKNEKGDVVGNKVYDWNALTEKLTEIKDAHPTEENIIISAEPTIKYRTIIKAMDASRDTKENGKIKKLFPNVILSAGVA